MRPHTRKSNWACFLSHAQTNSFESLLFTSNFHVVILNGQGHYFTSIIRTYVDHNRHLFPNFCSGLIFKQTSNDRIKGYLISSEKFSSVSSTLKKFELQLGNITKLNFLNFLPVWSHQNYSCVLILTCAEFYPWKGLGVALSLQPEMTRKMFIRCNFL